jgi:hypothetical protein
LLTDTPVRWTPTLDRDAEQSLRSGKFGHLMKKALQVTIGSAVLVAGLQSQAHANKLYDLIGSPPPSKIVNTGLPFVELGFSFSLPSGATPPYSATFDKIGFWVNNAVNPSKRSAIISLYDITTSGPGTGVPLGVPLLNLSIGNTESGAGGPSLCTMEGQFCFATIAKQTIDSGRTYLLTSKYSGTDNDNTYFARNLADPSQVAFLDNVAYGDTWFSPNVNFSPTSNHGAFGPNLGNVVVTGGPIPVPAPLPLLGASAALAYSRRIKARIKVAES